MAKKSIALDANGKPKFGIRDKLAYAAGDLGCNMSFSLKSTVQTFWLVYMTLETGLLSLLLLLVQTWDAVNDPLLGTLIDHDRRAYKHGKFKTYIFVGACGLLFGGAAVFLPFPGAPTLVKAMLFIVGYVIWDAFYTVANVPYGSMLSLVTNDVGERAQLSTWRSIGSMIGNMLPGLAGPVIVGMFGDRESIGYTIAGVSCAIIGFVICFLHYACTEERTTVGEEAKADDIKFSDILVVFKKNRPFVALCIHGICICLMQYATQTLGMYMYSGVYHDVTYQSIASALSSPFMIGSMILVPFICKKLGLEKLIRYSLLIGGAICGLLFVMHMTMEVPPLVHGVVLGIGSGFAMVSIQMQWGLVGEAIDYNEHITGKRTEGSIYGTFNLSRRIGQAIGSGFAFYALAWIGYDGTAAVQSAGTVLGLKALCVLVPAVFLI